MNYDHNKKFGQLKFQSGYGKFNLNSPKGYTLKIINAQTVCITLPPCDIKQDVMSQRSSVKISCFLIETIDKF